MSCKEGRKEGRKRPAVESRKCLITFDRVGGLYPSLLKTRTLAPCIFLFYFFSSRLSLSNYVDACVCVCVPGALPGGSTLCLIPGSVVSHAGRPTPLFILGFIIFRLPSFSAILHFCVCSLRFISLAIWWAPMAISLHPILSFFPARSSCCV